MSCQPTINSLCTDFMMQAIYTWKTIETGRITGIDFLEETLTDINLNNLQLKHPLEIRTQKYSKPKEGQVGADWEWWLGSQSGWLGLRVQAKKLDFTTLSYPELDHIRKSDKKRQVDLLVSFSLKEIPPRIPIYVLYNYWDTSRYDPPWLCGTYPKTVEILGCAIVDAFFVKGLINKGLKKLTDIANKMHPWSCLVCCHGYAQGRPNQLLADRAFEFLNRAFRQRNSSDKPPEDDAPSYERDRFVSKEAPSYVYRIAEGEKLSEENWSEIKVSRVTVIKALDDKYWK